MTCTSKWRGAWPSGWVAAAAAIGALIWLTPARAQTQNDVGGGTPVYAQTKNPPPATNNQEKETTIRATSNLVTTPVAVLDSRGQFVYDLSKTDFEIYDNGVHQRITQFESELQSMSLVIVVEANRKVAPLLDDVHPLASMFSSLLLGAQGQAAVLEYDDRVRVMQEFSNDGDKLAATFKDIGGRGDESRLNDALARAISMLAARPKSERRIVVVFSDGYDSGSRTGSDEVVRRATTAEVAIYGLGFSVFKEMLDRKPEMPPPTAIDNAGALPQSPGSIHTPTMSQNQYGTPVPVIPIMVASGEIIRSTLAKNLLEFYAGYTGGVYFSHRSDKDLQNQLNRIATEIQSQYELAYVPQTGEDKTFHRIEVRVNRPNVKVRARAGYFATEKTNEE